MRNQHRLGEILGKFLVPFIDPGPEPWRSLAKMLSVEFCHMRTGLQGIKKLIGFQLSHGNPAHQLRESFLSEPPIDVAKLHEGSVTQRGASTVAIQ